MGDGRADLRTVLHRARVLLERPGNDFSWSSWEDAGTARREIDGLLAELDDGREPARLTVEVLFAPTGPIQEVSLSSGWAEEFLALAALSDAAVEAFYGLRRNDRQRKH